MLNRDNHIKWSKPQKDWHKNIIHKFAPLTNVYKVFGK